MKDSREGWEDPFLEGSPNLLIRHQRRENLREGYALRDEDRPSLFDKHRKGKKKKSEIIADIGGRRKGKRGDDSDRERMPALPSISFRKSKKGGGEEGGGS